MLTVCSLAIADIVTPGFPRLPDCPDIVLTLQHSNPNHQLQPTLPLLAAELGKIDHYYLYFLCIHKLTDLWWKMEN